MPQAAVGAHRFGTFGFAGHSKNPRPPQPGQGSFASCNDAFFMGYIPNGQAGPAARLSRETAEPPVVDHLDFGAGRPPAIKAIHESVQSLDLI